MPLSSRISIDINARETKTEGLAEVAANHRCVKHYDFLSGVLADQADIAWSANDRAIAGSGNDDLDLNGVLTTAFGAPVAALKLVGVCVTAGPANTGNLIIGGAPTNPFVGMFGASTHTLLLRPNGVFLKLEPSLQGIGNVTAGTADILRIANGTASPATYDIILFARSA